LFFERLDLRLERGDVGLEVFDGARDVEDAERFALRDGGVAEILARLLEIARDAGVEFITVDREPFMELSKPIYDAFPAELRELAERIREVK
jgi:TRAP-type C4-dicarboxylate transport system substrate-binding protein